MAWQDNKEYVIRGGWDEVNQCYTGCETNDNGVISMCRVRELDEVFGATDAQITEAYERCRWEDIRAHRDYLIAQSDYLALQDTSAATNVLSSLIEKSEGDTKRNAEAMLEKLK